MFNRIQVGYTQGVRHQAACGRSSSRAHRNPMFFGIMDKISNNQKIPGKPHVMDNRQFILQPIRIGLFVNVRVSFFDFPNNFFKSRLDPLIEHIVNGPAAFGFELGKMVGLKIEVNVASGGNFLGVFNGLGVITEMRDHLFRRFEIELISSEFKSIRVFNGLSGLYAQKHIMRPDVLLIQIMTVIGGHHRNG